VFVITTFPSHIFLSRYIVSVENFKSEKVIFSFAVVGVVEVFLPKYSILIPLYVSKNIGLVLSKFTNELLYIFLENLIVLSSYLPFNPL